jgi:para-nitrobenzyl esterase
MIGDSGMRHLFVAALMLAATPAAAQAPATAPSAAPAAAAAAYSTTGTPIGTLLDDAAAKAILDKRVPGLTTNPQIEQARRMSLKDIQVYAADRLTDDVLKAIDADFAGLSGK